MEGGTALDEGGAKGSPQTVACAASRDGGVTSKQAGEGSGSDGAGKSGSGSESGSGIESEIESESESEGERELKEKLHRRRDMLQAKKLEGLARGMANTSLQVMRAASAGWRE